MESRSRYFQALHRYLNQVWRGLFPLEEIFCPHSLLKGRLWPSRIEIGVQRAKSLCQEYEGVTRLKMYLLSSRSGIVKGCAPTFNLLLRGGPQARQDTY
jgi:hypothetical protein